MTKSPILSFFTPPHHGAIVVRPPVRGNFLEGSCDLLGEQKSGMKEKL